MKDIKVKRIDKVPSLASIQRRAELCGHIQVVDAYGPSSQKKEFQLRFDSRSQCWTVAKIGKLWLLSGIGLALELVVRPANREHQIELLAILTLLPTFSLFLSSFQDILCVYASRFLKPWASGASFNTCINVNTLFLSGFFHLSGQDSKHVHMWSQSFRATVCKVYRPCYQRVILSLASNFYR